MAKKPARDRKAPRKAVAPQTQGQFIFVGTVLHLGTSTFAEVPVTDATVVVQVDQIVHGPDILADYAGQAITVQLGANQSVTEGQQYLLHTNGWIFGAGLAVVCVALFPASAAVVQETQAALVAAPALAVRARADRAELVVTGKVTEIREVPRAADEPISEHSPRWQEAVVSVADVPRGVRKRGAAGKQVVVRFASSRDAKWAAAPKFSVGQQGVWMLGDKSPEGVAARAVVAMPKGHYLVVEPEDFYPQEHVARVLAHLS